MYSASNYITRGMVFPFRTHPAHATHILYAHITLVHVVQRDCWSIWDPLWRKEAQDLWRGRGGGAKGEG